MNKLINADTTINPKISGTPSNPIASKKSAPLTANIVPKFVYEK